MELCNPVEEAGRYTANAQEIIGKPTDDTETRLFEDKKHVRMAGLYLHIPFCKSKCVYCGFYSTVSRRDTDKFLEVLAEEMAQKAPAMSGWVIRTVYFGGGTPSLLQPVQLQRIMDLITSRFHIGADAEVTIEANPEQLTADYCRSLKQLGFNRISIGIQSFHDEVLQFLGRKHTAEEALRAVENAHDAGFGNISIDLIYGVNGRGNKLWRNELETAFTLPIRHFSAYALTVEENSLLYRSIRQRRHAEPDEGLAAVQYGVLQEALAGSRFAQYEVSNYAEPGWESRHNSAYWQRVPYVGLGPAAHSFDGAHRSWNAPTLKGYFGQVAEGRPYFERETLTDTDRYNEFVLLGLRTAGGIDLREMARLFGPGRTDGLLHHFETEVAPRHYVRTPDRLRLTAEGFWFADGIAGGGFLTNG